MISGGTDDLATAPKRPWLGFQACHCSARLGVLQLFDGSKGWEQVDNGQTLASIQLHSIITLKNNKKILLELRISNSALGQVTVNKIVGDCAGIVYQYWL